MKKREISWIRLYFSLLLVIGILPLTGCTDRHLLSNTTIYIDDLTIEIGQLVHEGTVIEYKWDGTEEGLNIDIPELTDHNEKITKLGDYYPSCFGISLKPFDDGFETWTGPYGKPLEEGTDEWNHMQEARQEYMENSGNPLYGCIVYYKGEDEALYDAPISYDKMVFKINLSRYISSVNLRYYGWGGSISEYLGIRQEDGSIVFYEPAVYFTCDEENETFYAVDGRLYLKETNELVEMMPGFDYP